MSAFTTYEDTYSFTLTMIDPCTLSAFDELALSDMTTTVKGDADQ